MPNTPLLLTMTNKRYKKYCKKCNSSQIKRDGFMRWKQRYKCKDCNHVFQNKTRHKGVNINKLWNEYVFWKQTYVQLSHAYHLSVKTIQKYLDQYEFIPPTVSPREIILLIDTTYFWSFWIMVFKDCYGWRIINYKIVKNENNTDYKNGIQELVDEWWNIKAIVCDGRKGLLWWFWDIPTQMCQFHQVAIIRRYITKRPLLQANKDLKWITHLLKQTDRETFEYYIEQYGIYYDDFLKERAIWSDGRNHYIHKRTRSAYSSLKNNLKYLFTWYDYIWQVDIPNTTNWLEGFFSHVKTKLRVHSGLKQERKIKVILSLLFHKK